MSSASKRAIAILSQSSDPSLAEFGKARLQTPVEAGKSAGFAHRQLDAACRASRKMIIVIRCYRTGPFF